MPYGDNSDSDGSGRQYGRAVTQNEDSKESGRDGGKVEVEGEVDVQTFQSMMSQNKAKVAMQQKNTIVNLERQTQELRDDNELLDERARRLEHDHKNMKDICEKLEAQLDLELHLKEKTTKDQFTLEDRIRQLQAENDELHREVSGLREELKQAQDLSDDEEEPDSGEEWQNNKGGTDNDQEFRRQQSIRRHKGEAETALEHMQNCLDYGRQDKIEMQNKLDALEASRNHTREELEEVRALQQSEHEAYEEGKKRLEQLEHLLVHIRSDAADAEEDEYSELDKEDPEAKRQRERAKLQAQLITTKEKVWHFEEMANKNEALRVEAKQEQAEVSKCLSKSGRCVSAWSDVVFAVDDLLRKEEKSRVLQEDLRDTLRHISSALREVLAGAGDVWPRARYAIEDIWRKEEEERAARGQRSSAQELVTEVMRVKSMDVWKDILTAISGLVTERLDMLRRMQMIDVEATWQFVHDMSGSTGRVRSAYPINHEEPQSKTLEDLEQDRQRLSDMRHGLQEHRNGAELELNRFVERKINNGFPPQQPLSALAPSTQRAASDDGGSDDNDPSEFASIGRAMSKLQKQLHSRHSRPGGESALSTSDGRRACVTQFRSHNGDYY